MLCDDVVGETAQLGARTGLRPGPAAGRAVDDAEQRTCWQLKPRKHGIADEEIEHAMRHALAIDDQADDTRLYLGPAP